MWKQLFYNFCILVTVVFITSQLFKSTTIGIKSPVKIRILFGIIGGISSGILIATGLNLSENIVTDFYHIIEISVAFFGGLLSVSIAGIITAFVRLTYYGISNESIISSTGVLIVSIGCGVISLYKLSTRLKIAIMLLYSLIVRSIVLYIILENKEDAIYLIPILCMFSLIIGPGVYYLVDYLVAANQLMIKLKQESSHDFLTGLKNARQFDLKFNEILSQVVKNKNRISLLIIDIDHFKSVNDVYGHNAGDEVLKQLGQLLLRNSRNTDFVSRIGGEEFAIIFENHSKTETLVIAERIRKLIESNILMLPNGTQLKITVSTGVAVYPDTVCDVLALKETADMKLYEAKRSGRNTVRA